MGINKTYYMSEEVIALLEDVDNKGGLLNGLVIEYFDNSEEVLQTKLERADMLRNQLIAKLTKIRKDKEHKRALTDQAYAKLEKVQEVVKESKKAKKMDMLRKLMKNHDIDYTQLSVDECLRAIKGLKNEQYDLDMDFSWDIAIRGLKNGL